jgi:hypothetical protein
LAAFDQFPQQIRINDDDVICQTFEDEIVLFQLRNQQYYSLCAVGAHTWRLLADNGDVARVAERLCADYTGDPAAIRADFSEFLREILSAGLIRAV